MDLHLKEQRIAIDILNAAIKHEWRLADCNTAYVIIQGLQRNFERNQRRLCPCKLYPDGHTKDDICPCKEFRVSGHCHCGLYLDKEKST